MSDEFASFGESHLVHFVEACHEVAIAEIAVRNIDRGMTVKAGAGLLSGDLAFGVGLVGEHVGVAALFAKITRECVTRPHGFQARIFLKA